jgi:hypothetical protein
VSTRTIKHASLGRSIALILVALSLVLLGALALPRLIKNAAKPFIAAVDPPVGDPGAALRIVGRNFGDERQDSRVEFDGVAPTASSYLSWTDDLIELRVPLYAETSMVRVRTESGLSNPRMFMSLARLPVRPSGAGAGTVGPVIDSLSVDQGTIGSLLVVRGLNFGSNRDSSAVQFSWQSAAAAFPGQDDGSNRGFISPAEDDGEYLSWSDKEIRVIVPDGAVSGSVSVRTNRGASAARYFQVVDSPGSKTFTDRRTYALSSFVAISRVRSDGPNSLHIWLPYPESSPSQRGVKTLGRSFEPLVPEYRGLSLYQISDLADDKLLTVSHDHLVQVYAIETDIKADRVKAPPSPAPALYTLYTQADSFVPADAPALKAAAAKAAGRERNHYRAARLVYDALLSTLRYDPASLEDNPPAAFEAKRADSWDFSLIYVAMLRSLGVPARPVSGVVVDDSRRAWNHSWAEFYLYGLGWVPVDIVLGSGASIGGFEAPFEDRSRYFGNLDARHIAFSEGIVRVAPLSPDGRTIAAKRRYSMQTIYEEASGALRSYTSFWSDVEVTGIY